MRCITCQKSSVWPVTLFDTDLVVISAEQINGTEDFVLSDSVDGVINARQRKHMEESELIYHL